jgi:hypothetical protein
VPFVKFKKISTIPSGCGHASFFMVLHQVSSCKGVFLKHANLSLHDGLFSDRLPARKKNDMDPDEYLMPIFYLQLSLSLSSLLFQNREKDIHIHQIPVYPVFSAP